MQKARTSPEMDLTFELDAVASQGPLYVRQDCIETLFAQDLDYRSVNDLTRLQANHFCVSPANELVSQVRTAPRKHKWSAVQNFLQIVFRGAQRLCATRVPGDVHPRAGGVRALRDSADKILQAVAELVTARQEKPASFGVQEVGFLPRVSHLFGALPGLCSALVAQLNTLT
jgi:hypothetical protein